MISRKQMLKILERIKAKCLPTHVTYNKSSDKLDVIIPLDRTLKCPITSKRFWPSFIEIFCVSHYKKTFEYIPWPDRWIDIGCHAGFFTLWVLWMKRKLSHQPNCKALLLDADPRVKKQIERIVTDNSLKGDLKFLNGLISSKMEEMFYLRSETDSSTTPIIGRPENPPTITMKTITAEKIINSFQPPYDLIKIDIEGSEYDFLKNYRLVMKHTKYILLEWHSWILEHRGEEEINELTVQAGFQLIHTSPHSHILVHANRPLATLGTNLYVNTRLT